MAHDSGARTAVKIQDAVVGKSVLSKKGSRFGHLFSCSQPSHGNHLLQLVAVERYHLYISNANL